MANEPKKQRRGWLPNLFSTNTNEYQKEAAIASDITTTDTLMYGAGMTTVASLMSSGNRAARTRQSIYDQWSMMEGDPIVSTSLGLLVTAALGGHETTGDTVFIEKRPQYTDCDKMKKLVDEVSADLLPLLNKIAFTSAYLGAAFGDAYGRIYSDETGVVDVYIGELVRPPLVQPFEQGSRTIGYAVYTGPKNFQRLDKTQMARLKMPRTQWVPQHGVFEKSLKLALEEDDVNALPLMPAMAGGSLLYPAEDPYNNLAASLVGLVGQRWMDSIDEQMLTVNLNDMSKDHQERFIKSITEMLKKSKSVAEEAVKGGKPIMEKIRHVIPVFGDKQLTAMGPANGGQSGRNGNINIEDIMLHARLLAGAIGVDLSMIGFADQMAGGLGEGGFFRSSAQVAERARTIRVALAEFFNEIADIHTLKKYGVVFPPSERPWSFNFYGSISALEAELQRTRSESMGVGLMLLQGIQSLQEMAQNGASKEMITDFLTDIMSHDEDQTEIYTESLMKNKEGGDESI